MHIQTVFFIFLYFTEIYDFIIGWELSSRILPLLGLPKVSSLVQLFSLYKLMIFLMMWSITSCWWYYPRILAWLSGVISGFFYVNFSKNYGAILEKYSIWNRLIRYSEGISQPFEGCITLSEFWYWRPLFKRLRTVEWKN